MQTRGPTITHILVALGFALSCFGLLLFLWLAFGGPVPLKSEGYRITVPFQEATQLAVESDVRISGVSVGKVKEIEEGDGAAQATLEVDNQYAPLPENTEATLRAKTLLGETYVELTPGDPASGAVADGGSLDAAQVSNAVQLDEILRTFDPQTREAFQVWMQQGSIAFANRGADLSIALASLDPFSEEAQRILTTLDTQRQAVRELVSGGADVFEALSERQGQLRGLIENTNAVFATTARRNRELAEAFVVLPTFLEESRLTLQRLDEFARDTDPLVRQLRPAARELSPTLIAAGRLAPELEGLFKALRPTIDLAPRGFPALRRTLNDALPPLLGELEPFFNQLTPIVRAANKYRHEVTAFLANASTATNAAGFGARGPVNYLRTTSPLNPGSLAAYPRRLKIERSNPYTKPLGYEKLAGGLESFQTDNCSNGLSVTLTNFNPGPPPYSMDEDTFEGLKLYAFGDETQSDLVPHPPCKQQAPYKSIGGPPRERTQYLHVRPDR